MADIDRTYLGVSELIHKWANEAGKPKGVEFIWRETSTLPPEETGEVWKVGFVDGASRVVIHRWLNQSLRHEKIPFPFEWAGVEEPTEEQKAAFISKVSDVIDLLRD